MSTTSFSEPDDLSSSMFLGVGCTQTVHISLSFGLGASLSDAHRLSTSSLPSFCVSHIAHSCCLSSVEVEAFFLERKVCFLRNLLFAVNYYLKYHKRLEFLSLPFEIDPSDCEFPVLERLLVFNTLSFLQFSCRHTSVFTEQFAQYSYYCYECYTC